MRSSKTFFERFGVLSLWRPIAALSTILCLGAVQLSAQSGTVFRDYDGDGTQDPGEPGVAGVVVRSYINGSPDVLLGSATSGSGGTYTLLPAAGAGQAVRVEFTIPLLTNAASCLDPNVDYSSSGGATYGSSVQFVTGPASGIDFAVNNPEDYVDPALTNPILWTTVYQNGNASQATKSLVGVNYDASGEITEAPISEIGSTWGVAYSRQAKRVFASAFLKRHVGLGPLGSGGIYMLDPATNVVTDFIDLDALGFPTRASGAYSATFTGTTVNFSGVPGNNTERNLPADQNQPNNDPAAFAQVGKIGLGDIDISDDGRYLWVTNLYDRKLYRIDLQNGLAPVAPTAAQVTSYTISNPCGGTDNRPFGVRVYRGKVYVGVVCSGESGGNPIGNILEFDGASFNTIFTFPLNYTRPAISGLSLDPATFGGWSDDYATGRRSTPGTTNALWTLPQPILSDIEFDTDGTMILGIMDRAGHQMGWGNWEPQNSDLWITIAAGDILRAYRKSDCTWELESNGKEGPSSTKAATTGAGNGQGPGGGEFYVGDNGGAGTFHSEVMLGGLALKKGSNEVVSSCYDPNGLDEFGLLWMSNTTGEKTKGWTIGAPGNPFYGGSNNTFGKGGAVGDVEIEANLPVLEIGNRVWMDTDNDGVQDPDEMGVSGVNLNLYKVLGMTETLVGTTSTGGTGEFYFNNSNVTLGGATGLVPNMDYKIRVDAAQFTGGSGLGILAGKILGPPNISGAGATDLADNDATVVGGLAEISLTTGDYGENNHTYDFGFAPCALDVTGMGTNPICPGASTGAVNITVTGAIGVPTYAWSNMTATEDLTGVPAGTYSVTVTDPGVCSATYSTMLTDPAGMTLGAVPTASPTCMPSTGSINLTVTGAAAPVSYLWSNGAITEDISGLAPGTYTVVVTDGNMCTASTSAMVGGPTNPTLMATPTPVACFGGSTGSINLTVTPGSAGGPNTYLWSNSETTEDISALPAGTYTVVVTDAGGCTASTSAMVGQPAAPLAASATVSTVDCINGDIDLTVTGGTVSYSYLWNTGLVTQDISVPDPGTYTVEVTDMNGCTTSTSVTYGGCDKGDLPAPYATLNANTGASHVIVTGLKIGATVDAETDGQPTVPADGDGADEDGFDPLAPANMLVAGRTTNIAVPVMNMTGGDAKLTVYFDWNKDGDIADLNEMYSVVVPDAATSATLVVAVPADAVLNMDLGTRFRLTTSTTMASTGFAPDGEVEDYLVQVMGFDYGDLADSGAGAGVGNYETQDANGGPSHKITPTLKLGASVDAEGNGQQSTNADGDDSTTAPGTDDEDGVTLPMFVTGVPSDITVSLMNMTGVDAKLTVFIDFNNNGVFEASEMYSTTVIPNPGAILYIPVTPPLTSWLNAPVGVRVRLSTDMTASMSPTGPAPDGEVEDYTTVIMGFDYGDLNDPSAGTGTAPFGTAANYSTLATDNGAAHKLTTNPLTNEVILKIGTAEDDEATGQPVANAGRLGGGDDAVETPDDEDGLDYAAMPLFIVTQTTVLNIPVMNMTGSDAKLVAWCDFNKDGDFLDAGEMVSTTVANNATTATINFPVPAPPAAAVGEWVGLRLRLASATEPMVSVGPLNSGEVEDYEVQIIGYDYGDQPNTYGTTDPNGPRHIITNDLKLGASVDAEVNGVPDAMAGLMGAGDDGDPGLVTFGTSTPAGDDENGIMLTAPMVPGTTSTFMCDAMNMTTSPAVLQAWVDFNGDGDFLDANEHLTTGSFAPAGAVVPVGGLSGAKLTFDVPAGAVFNAGNAHVRFRLSPLGGLAPNTQTDPVPFGEIEDYKFPLAVVGNMVFQDYDFDGVQDAGEPGIDNVGVMLTWAGADNTIGTADDVMYNTTTGPASGQQTGEYYVSGLINGTYKVKFTTPANMTPTRTNQGGNDVLDSDGAITGMDLTMAMETFTIVNVTALPTAENGNGDNGTAPTGTFPDNQSDETHDQGFAFLDYGDLPENGGGDQFNTSMVEGGAVHVVIPGFKLGASVDGERDGVGNATATGDDTNNTGSADDEDGVSFTSPLIPGYNATISVVSMNPTGAAAVLQGWIDWNNNGLLDAAEALAFTSSAVPTGNATTTFTFPVPATAIFNDGMVFARFRLSPTGGLSADGPDKYGVAAVPQGEVEDYMKKVMCAGNIVWEDYDFDGTQDVTEPGIGGVTVNMVWGGPDGNVTTTADNVTYTTTTLSAAAGGNIIGEYSFCGLIEGQYKFVAITPSDMTPTNGNVASAGDVKDSDGIVTSDITMTMTDPFTVTLPQIVTQPTGEDGNGDNAPGNLGTFPDNQVNETFDFGFVSIDFGDLPDTYVTDDTPDNSGAQHVMQPGKYLGTCVDAEQNANIDPSGQAGLLGSGDDADASTRTQGTCTTPNDDENGVTFPTPLIPGYEACVDVTYTAIDVPGLMRTGNTFLSLWIDYNGDGDVTDAGEQAVTDLALLTGTDVSRRVCFTVPSGATFNGGAARVRARIHCQPGLGSAGLAVGGEVEDYYVPVAKIGNYVWFDNDLEGDQNTTDTPNPGTTLAEAGINGVTLALVWYGEDGLFNTSDDRIYLKTTAAGTQGELEDEGGTADGIYYFCGVQSQQLDGKNYRIVPIKYATDINTGFATFSDENGVTYDVSNAQHVTVNGTATDRELLTAPRKILTIPNNAPVSDNMDSDNSDNAPYVNFMVPSLVPAGTLPTGENGVGDIPTVFNYPDNRTNLTLDMGFVQEPNIEITQQIMGVEKGDACGQFKIIMDACVWNSGGYENGYQMSVPLRDIQVEAELASQLGAAFLSVMGDPVLIVEGDNNPLTNAASVNADCGIKPQPAHEMPTVNAGFDGSADVNLLSGTNGILWPGEKLRIRYMFQVKPSNLPEPQSLNLLLQAEATGKAVNYQNQIIQDFFTPGAPQYVAEDLSNDGVETFDGTYNDPDVPTNIGDCWKTSQSVAANDMVQISLPETCEVLIKEDMILEGEDENCIDDAYCLGGYYRVNLRTMLGNFAVPNPVPASYIGQVIIAEVENIASCNKVWGKFILEDKLPPVITNCPSGITVSCAYTADQLQNPTFTQGLGLALPTVSDCSSYTADVAHGWQDIACNGTPAGVSAILTRTWTYTDVYGNISLPCVQTITLQRATLAEVNFPVDVTVQCSAAASATEPSATGVPTVPAVAPAGGRLNIYPNSNYCEMQATYADQIIDVCPGTYKILRTWTVYDWCTATTPGVNPLTYLQLIKVVDEHGPDVVTTYPSYPVPSNMTVSTGSNDCTGTVNLPAFIVADNCSAVQTAQATISGAGIAEHGVSAVISSNFVGSNAWSSERLVDFGNTNALPLGTYSVNYTFTDACGNATHVGPFTITVEDQTPPVAVCDEWTQVALGANGQVVVYAGTFDDGSYDNCAPVQLRVRRMDAGCNISNANFTPSVTFCCDDVNDTLQVILRMYDVLAPLANSVAQDAHEGHYNDCMVNVLVEDKLKPICTPPANVQVSCDNFDPSLWPYGTATASDNCTVVSKDSVVTGTLNTCNIGTLTRRWTVRDAANLTSTCQQTITVTPNQYYFVRFPEDKVITNCVPGGDYGAPEFYGEDCELLATSFVDEVFTVVPDACYKIERTWTVINWCSYNSNTPCTVVPNPDGETHGKVIVSAAGNGINGWAPSSMPVTASGQTVTYNYGMANGGTTNAAFAGFGGWSQNANCYKYKQIIKIIDNAAPTVVSTTVADSCDYTTNDESMWHHMSWWDEAIDSHNLCEGAVNLSITATDACAGENVKIRYQLYLDLDGDINNVMETVVPGSVQAPTLYGAVRYNNYQNQNFGGGEIRPFVSAPLVANNFGFGLETQVSGDNLVATVRFVNTANVVQNTAVQLPYGTHKIKWIIEDGCGNEKVHETTFTVRDCKKPTVVCTNGVSVNLMNGPMNTVSLWAIDLYEYVNDNCTPEDLLLTKVRVVRADADNGSLPTGTSVDFSCADLLPGLSFGTVVVNVYAEDAAGNFDFCAMAVQVQDNMNVCGNGTNASVAGALQTEVVDGVQDAAVELDGSANGIPMLETTLSALNGEYLFNNTIPIASNATITPTLDVDPLNGVNTWDLVLISRHILGLEPLGSPYKLIAADANKSGTVTTFDIVELRKLILGTYQVLPNNTSWRFINAHQEFTSDENPFADVIQENIQIANIQGSILDGNFVGAKIGDVDGSAIPNQLVSADDRTTGMLLFDVEDRTVKAGEVFTLTLKAAQAVKGYQFTLNLNGLEAMEAVPGEGMTADNFGIFPGAVTTSADGTPGVFGVTFRATKSGRVSEMLSVSSRITRAMAFDGANRLDVALRFHNGAATTIASQGFELYQNAPNPWISRTVIGFYLPEATEARLTIFDGTGRVLHTAKGDFGKGYNAFPLDRKMVDQVSQLYYKVETATDSDVKQMIQTR